MMKLYEIAKYDETIYKSISLFMYKEYKRSSNKT